MSTKPLSVKPLRRVLRLLSHLPRRLVGHLADRWRRLLLSLVIVVSLLGGGGLLAAWMGLVSISASSGHWGITYSLLQFAMHNAVETQSLGIKAPDLDDPALVLKGAGHYATGCMQCHGAPGDDRPLVMQQMTPEPPFLPPKIKDWTTGQLFWIVKHGIKFTAMPAWVSLERDDEVWAMVAFLQKLPDLSPEQYQQLAYGEVANSTTGTFAENKVPDDDPLQPTLADCARCHGVEGNGRGLGAAPKLAGQSEAYLRASLQAYASGERNSGIMQPIAADLSKATIEAVARYYSEQERMVVQGNPSGQDNVPLTIDAQLGPAEAKAARIEKGRKIAMDGIPAQGVPSCMDCHGPGGSPRNPRYPELAGQYAGYLALQLTLFKSGHRGGTAYADIMHTVTKGLTEKEIQDLALYYESLGGGSTGGEARTGN